MSLEDPRGSFHVGPDLQEMLFFGIDEARCGHDLK